MNRAAGFAPAIERQTQYKIRRFMMYHGVYQIIRQPVLPPMNPARHLLKERNVDGAETIRSLETGLAETLPQRSPMYPNCTATTSHASGIQSGERQIVGPPPME